jgi:SAM-dependent methyltransferase
MPFDVDYAFANASYADRRSRGNAGWFPQSEYERFFAQLDQFAPYDTCTALELGCGAGNVSAWLAGRGYRVTGIDTCDKAIAWARDRFRSQGLAGEFLVGDVRALPFRDGTFGLIVDARCMHWLVREADRRAMLAEARRVLSADGTFVVASQVGHPPREHWAMLGYDPETRCQIRGGLAISYCADPDALRAEVTSVGFSIVRAEHMTSPQGDELLLECRAANA